MKAIKAVHKQLSSLQVNDIDLGFKVLVKVLWSHHSNSCNSSDCVTVIIFRNICYTMYLEYSLDPIGFQSATYHFTNSQNHKKNPQR